MYDTAEQIRRVQLRAGQIHRQRENRLLGGLGSLCMVLTFSLIGAIGALTGGGRGGMVPGLYGAMLLYEGAGGYVVVAVLSFAAAVVITVLCIRHGAKFEKHSKGDKEKEQAK